MPKEQLTVFRFNPINWAVFVASMSMQKHVTIFDPVGTNFSVFKHFFDYRKNSDGLEHFKY
jgi:hypothetical protein